MKKTGKCECGRQPFELSFSAKELCNKISTIYDINPTKRFKAQVELALKRGVNYGLLRRFRNKYRYEPSPNYIVREKDRRKKPVRQRTMKASSSKTTRKQPPPDKRGHNVPRPTVPPPPNWKPQPRHLLTEPFKVIKKPSF